MVNHFMPPPAPTHSSVPYHFILLRVSCAALKSFKKRKGEKKNLPGAHQHVFHVLPSALFLTCRLNVNGFDNVILQPKGTPLKITANAGDAFFVVVVVVCFACVYL